jgi:hypothetical protein
MKGRQVGTLLAHDGSFAKGLIRVPCIDFWQTVLSFIVTINTRDVESHLSSTEKPVERAMNCWTIPFDCQSTVHIGFRTLNASSSSQSRSTKAIFGFGQTGERHGCFVLRMLRIENRNGGPCRALERSSEPPVSLL